MILCTAVVGAIFGFLRFNTYPATVLMGDTGSQLLGFLAITLAMGITQGETPLEPAGAALAAGVPGARHPDGDGRAHRGRPFAVCPRQEPLPPQAHAPGPFPHRGRSGDLWHRGPSDRCGVFAALSLGMADRAAVYIAFCGMAIGFFTLAERQGLRFTARGSSIRDQGPAEGLQGQEAADPGQLPGAAIRVAADIRRGRPGAGERSGYLAAGAADLPSAIFIVRWMRWQWVNPVHAGGIYLMAPMVLSLGQHRTGQMGHCRPCWPATTMRFGALAFSR